MLIGNSLHALNLGSKIPFGCPVRNLFSLHFLEMPPVSTAQSDLFCIISKTRYVCDSILPFPPCVMLLQFLTSNVWTNASEAVTGWRKQVTHRPLQCWRGQPRFTGFPVTPYKVFSAFIRSLIDCFIMTFTLGVRDSIMIAHSFHGDAFGPAQALHGATYTVEAEWSTSALEEPQNWVMDMGEASRIVANALAPYQYGNLDAKEELRGENTTTEFLARLFHERIARQIRGQFVGILRITLHESFRAWARYEAPIS